MGYIKQYFCLIKKKHPVVYCIKIVYDKFLLVYNYKMYKIGQKEETRICTFWKFIVSRCLDSVLCGGVDCVKIGIVHIRENVQSQ